VILVSVGSASTSEAQCVLQREAQSGKMWFYFGGISPNETHVVAVVVVLLREIGLPFSSDDLQLVRDKIASVTLSDGKKQNVSVFSASTPPHFIVTHFRNASKIEASIDNVPTQLAKGYVDYAFFTISRQYLTPTQNGNVRYSKPSHKRIHLGIVASWQAFRNAVIS
jgi:hypothetical protein